jgi:hypothetical protein
MLEWCLKHISRWEMPVKKLNRTLFVAALIVAAMAALSAETRAGGKYESRGRRDPFVPLVGVSDKGGRGGIKGIHTIDDVKLQGIVRGADGVKRAIINGEIMKEGDKIERLSVIFIEDNGVKVKIEETEYELKLYK